MLRQPPAPVDILILGAGWTSTFLIPLLNSSSITYAATSTAGRSDTIKFKYEPGSTDISQFKRLPPAKTVLVTFPLKGTGQSREITKLYGEVHGQGAFWVQLGSTGIFTQEGWSDSTSAYDKESSRAVAEDELLDVLGEEACVLNLAGLYGGEREPRNWITRVAKTKEEVKGKGALHLVHGMDVARAVAAVHLHREGVEGHRWIITDLRTYDWWDLINDWGAGAKERAEKGEDPKVSMEEAKELDFVRWVGELMVEEHVRALPRGVPNLGRVLDSREFWRRIGCWPMEGRVK